MHWVTCYDILFPDDSGLFQNDSLPNQTITLVYEQLQGLMQFGVLIKSPALDSTEHLQTQSHFIEASSYILQALAAVFYQTTGHNVMGEWWTLYQSQFKSALYSTKNTRQRQ